MMTDNDPVPQPDTDLVVGDLLPLPNLSPGDFAFATKEETQQWLADLMSFYQRGDFHTEQDGGLALQFVTENVLRCVRVYDHPQPLLVLAMLQCTCEAKGVTLLLDGALLTPMPDDTVEEVATSPPKPPTETKPNPNEHLKRTISASSCDIGMEVV
jgi:hypothetical protein